MLEDSEKNAANDFMSYTLIKHSELNLLKLSGEQLDSLNHLAVVQNINLQRISVSQVYKARLYPLLRFFSVDDIFKLAVKDEYEFHVIFRDLPFNFS